jgi:hypothetical protein
VAWELIIAALAGISICSALLFSALGLITIPDAVYQALSTLVLALLGTRGRRIGQRRNLKKKYGNGAPADPELDDQDAHAETYGDEPDA